MSAVALGPDDLVLCSGTLLDRSLREVVEAAAAGGFRGISIWPRQVERSRRGDLRDTDLCGFLEDHDVVVVEIEPVLSWLAPDQVPPAARDLLGPPPELFLDLAEELGAGAVLATDGFGTQVDRMAVLDAFRGLCDRADDRGLEVRLEFLPWSPIVPDAASAHAFLAEADRPRTGLVVDAWHVFRGAGDLEAIRALPGEIVRSIQLNDAPARAAIPDAPLESMHHRRVPGEGDLDLVGLVRALDATGTRAPIGIEVFSDALAPLSPAEIGVRLGGAARRLLDRARDGGGSSRSA